MKLLLEESMMNVIECVGGIAILTIIGTFFAFSVGAVPSDSNLYVAVWGLISALTGG